MVLRQFACCLNLSVSPVFLADTHSLGLVLGSELCQMNHMLYFPYLFCSGFSSLHCCTLLLVLQVAKRVVYHIWASSKSYLYLCFSPTFTKYFCVGTTNIHSNLKSNIVLFLAFPNAYTVKTFTKLSICFYSYNQKMEYCEFH